MSITSLTTSLQLRYLEGAAVVAMLVLVGLHAVVTSDISFHDEAAYLYRGLAISTGVMPNFTDGATYSDMYWLLGHLATDPIGLYFAGRAFAAVAFVFAIWLASRMFAQPALAWVAAACVAMMPAPYVWPGVAGPAAALVLVGLALLFKFPTSLVGLGIVAGMFWVAAGSRPEFVWFAAFTSVVAIASLLYRVRSSGGSHKLRATIAVTFGAVLMPLTLVALHGNPLASSGRQWIAFSQHYALRSALPGEDPWYDAGIIVGRSFDDADSILHAVVTNPYAMARHILANAGQFTREFAVLVGFSGTKPYLSSGAVLLVAIALTLAVAVGLNIRLSALRARLLVLNLAAKDFRTPLTIMSFAITAIGASVLVIYPRQHYLLVLVGIFMVALGIALQRVGAPWASTATLGTVALLLFSAFAVQTAQMVIKRSAYPAPLAATAARMVDSGQRWTLLGVDWGLSVFVSNLEQVTSYDALPNESFTAYLDRLGINAILSNDRLRSSRWASMPGFGEFDRNPEKFGFQTLFPGSDVLLRGI